MTKAPAFRIVPVIPGSDCDSDIVEGIEYFQICNAPSEVFHEGAGVELIAWTKLRVIVRPDPRRGLRDMVQLRGRRRSPRSQKYRL
ncbi:MAG TPA: hypothetical protein VGH40_19980 [Roseiarcus sp.]